MYDFYQGNFFIGIGEIIMGATVQETVSKRYTDISGAFYEGMTAEDAAKKKSIFNFFYKPETEFNRIDTDNDGVLSKGEITEELRRNADAERHAIKVDSLWGMGFAGWGLLSKKLNKKHDKVALFMTLFNLAGALHSKYRLNQINERIAQGCN